MVVRIAMGMAMDIVVGVIGLVDVIGRQVDR